MPHQDRGEELTYAAHGPLRQKEDDVRYGAHKAPDKSDDVYTGACTQSSGQQLGGRSHSNDNARTDDIRDKELNA